MKLIKQDLIINRRLANVKIKNKEIKLTRLEMEILSESLEGAMVHSEMFGISQGSMTTHIKSLRRKIYPYGDNILTIFRIGYKIFDS